MTTATSTIDVSKIVPEPSKLREAIARNMRERRALELALKTSEFVATELSPPPRAASSLHTPRARGGGE